MVSAPLKYFQDEPNPPPFIKALAEVRQLATREGWCYFHVHVNRAQAERVIEAARRQRELPLLIDPAPGLTVSQIAARARRHKQKLERQGLLLGPVIVDHMHIVKPSNRYPGARVNEFTEISGSLKALAKEWTFPFWRWRSYRVKSRSARTSVQRWLTFATPVQSSRMQTRLDLSVDCIRVVPVSRKAPVDFACCRWVYSPDPGVSSDVVVRGVLHLGRQFGEIDMA
ncbi:hypothetical protein LMTR3_07920 [Bradyrhizobium sp. LMTR 3]|nr:hypothetical protein LMTR3_07920 [Bradyrhizobium sp. LMTR 3]